MATEGSDSSSSQPKYWYSVWGLAPAEFSERVKKLMAGLRSEYGGPDFEPHVTVVGVVNLTEEEAKEKFRAAVDGLKVYPAKVNSISTGTFYYQCVFLLLDPTPEVVEPSAHCSSHFGLKSSSPYMPHMSLLYGDLSDEQKKAAKDKADKLDECIGTMGFPVTRLALYKTDINDSSTKSWEMILDHNLLSS